MLDGLGTREACVGRFRNRGGVFWTVWELGRRVLNGLGTGEACVGLFRNRGGVFWTVWELGRRGVCTACFYLSYV